MMFSEQRVHVRAAPSKQSGCNSRTIISIIALAGYSSQAVFQILARVTAAKRNRASFVIHSKLDLGCGVPLRCFQRDGLIVLGGCEPAWRFPRDKPACLRKPINRIGPVVLFSVSPYWARLTPGKKTRRRVHNTAYEIRAQRH